MSQENIARQPRTYTARSILLIMLVIGAGASLTVYALSNAFGVSPQPTQNTPGNAGLQWHGFPHGQWGEIYGGSGLAFGATSTVSNVTITGFQVTDSGHITVNLSYQGIGASPSITAVGFGPGLSGSNTLSSGWSSLQTLIIHLIGQGSLSGSTSIRVIIVPLTGA
ncbi:MAG TPA: hypothetical protein VFE98_03305 [Candidatus Bathyarchaeia archaeon]|nr:hypothetical protein [Candidatus Bathyarchaeia archaeon]